MAKIKVLPSNIANKIAAGEVVDRPASVVKELVENAIDAEATRITAVISQSGKELIQVIDNGVGMDEKDAELAFERHATSKVSDVHDLDRIMTLGFRGEALPSIASVSRLEIKTSTGDNDVGTLLKLEGGKITPREKLALKQGTTISVKNLFYNTPARRNFLRADTTEFNHILKELKRFFLAYPGIHFTLIHNGEELFNLPATTQDERIVHVFDQKFYEGLVYVREELSGMVLDGYVCRPDQARGNSANQFVFLNRRTIINRNLAHAVFQGYGNLIERSRYPQFIMFLQIAPQQVDVNVHPTKMEVRFANERVIPARGGSDSPNTFPSFRPASPESGKKPAEENPSQITFSYDPMPPKALPAIENERFSPEVAGEATLQQPLLWQVHNRYILSQIKSGLVIIDQHVAHERILYEQILTYLNAGKNVPSQQLLFPQTIELPLEDYLVYGDIKEWLEKTGFVITELSGRAIVIEAIPMDVKVGKEAKVLLEIIDFYRANEGNKFEPREKIAAAFACKNAIKSGERLSVEAMNALVNQLFQTREPYFCPHGRPVIVTLALEELDRKFKRI
jgi:DNA mismatch repair protein MutL